MTARPATPGTAPPRLRLVYFGSGAFGLPTLERLSRDHDVLAVVSQPDRPAGRKRLPTPTPVGQWASEHLPGADLLKPEDVNDPEHIRRIRAYPTGSESDRTGAWVVIAFGQKLSQTLLSDRFAINLHASLLPRWRGAAPINHAVMAGDTQTGNSVITLADRMDAGLVLGQSRRPIDPDLTSAKLHDQLAGDGPQLVGSVLHQFASDALEPVSQDPSLVTAAPKLSKDMGSIDLSTLSADAARRLVHGLNPWPAVTVRFRNQPLKILRVRVEDRLDPGPAGTFADAATGLIRCAGGSLLRLIEVQPAGRTPMPFASFANGAKPEIGERLTQITGGKRPC